VQVVAANYPLLMCTGVMTAKPALSAMVAYQHRFKYIMYKVYETYQASNFDGSPFPEESWKGALHALERIKPQVEAFQFHSPHDAQVLVGLMLVGMLVPSEHHVQFNSALLFKRVLDHYLMNDGGDKYPCVIQSKECNFLQVGVIEPYFVMYQNNVGCDDRSSFVKEVATTIFGYRRSRHRVIILTQYHLNYTRGPHLPDGFWNMYTKAKFHGVQVMFLRYGINVKFVDYLRGQGIDVLDEVPGDFCLEIPMPPEWSSHRETRNEGSPSLELSQWSFAQYSAADIMLDLTALLEVSYDEFNPPPPKITMCEECFVRDLFPFHEYLEHVCPLSSSPPQEVEVECMGCCMELLTDDDLGVVHTCFRPQVSPSDDDHGGLSC